MKILVIGSGGREHALVWKLRQSPRVEHVWCAPGNAGIAREAECVPVDVGNVDALLQLAATLKPDLTVVGPELPLSLGVVDEFQQRGLRIFGPTRAAAQLETSKSFAKEFMQRHHIPTAHYSVCISMNEVRSSLGFFKPPLVVKADGLAAGKGVVIAQSKDEAEQTAAEMLAGNLVGEAGARVVLEEFLTGEELSFLVMSDGERVVPLVPSQDHKRVGDGDTGPNTGGMGAYSADELLDAPMREWLLTHIARPVVAGMKAEGAEFRGILYCGLMMTARGPMVLEFNCRFGDPETQPILMRMESDLLDAFEAAIDGRASEGDFKWSAEPAVCVVLASGGYPGAFEKGKKITGLDRVEESRDLKVFHAGTSVKDSDVVTSGGRVLGVTGRGPGLRAAVERVYRAVSNIQFAGMHFRRDIAARLLDK